MNIVIYGTVHVKFKLYESKVRDHSCGMPKIIIISKNHPGGLKGRKVKA